MTCCLIIAICSSCITTTLNTIIIFSSIIIIIIIRSRLLSTINIIIITITHFNNFFCRLLCWSGMIYICIVCGNIYLWRYWIISILRNTCILLSKSRLWFCIIIIIVLIKWCSKITYLTPINIIWCKLMLLLLLLRYFIL